jgi:hypothetical protein
MDLVPSRQECDRVKGLMKPITIKNFKVARQHNSKLVGTVSNLIFYNFRGKYYMRAKPVSVRRTEASVRSGLNFGKASKISRQIRADIQSINPCNSDKQMIYRFTGTLNKMISWKEKQDTVSTVRPAGLPFIQGFQFNDRADLTDITAIRVSMHITEPGLIEIRFAAFVPREALHAPFNTDHIIFKMVLISTNPTDLGTEKLGTAEIKIPYVSELFQPPVVSMPVRTTQGSFMIMVLAVQYMVNKRDGIEMLTDFRKLPCGVVWAG